jgi:hypothetical protein
MKKSILMGKINFSLKLINLIKCERPDKYTIYFSPGDKERGINDYHTIKDKFDF